MENSTPCKIVTPENFIFSKRELRYVCYAIAVLSSVTLVRPTLPVEIFGNFFHHTIAQGL